MIGFTKLLCGKATVSEAVKQAMGGSRKDPSLLQFTTANRPLVVWNMTTGCNLRCSHCYNASGLPQPNELTTAEAETMIADLGQMGVPVLLFSGGEPLLRKDLFHLASYAASKGIRTGLSTNGTLITAEVAERLMKAKLQYVGVSIDGLEQTHDHFRCQEGAYEAAWKGVREALKASLKAGIRFTATRDNVADLPGVLARAVREGVPRFCLYHLVYSGRGAGLADHDLTIPERRIMIEWLVEKTEELYHTGHEIEILTTDNHCDGILLYRIIAARDPVRAEEVLELLAMHGGCSAGRKVANIDAVGNVHACQFWGEETLGNVRERPFSDIWQKPDHPLLCNLKELQNQLVGRCGDCSYKVYCGGCRIRAQASHGDLWGADPCCYLTDEEIKGDVVETAKRPVAI